MIIAARISACVIAALVFIAAAPLAADIRGTDINGKPVILRSDGTWSYTSPPSGKTATCRRYTDNAIVQQRANLKRRCGFTGVRWHQDYNTHYNWCMSASAASRGGETIARRDALNRCSNRLKATACQRYTDNALAQQRANLKRRCGFTGGSWHQDYNRHYNWCMGVKTASQNANTIARRDALAKCSDRSKAKTCQRYTDNALVQQRANLKRRCGFTGVRWHQDYNTHYNWCMSTSAASRGGETIARRDALVQCSSRLKATACQRYTDNALAQQRANLKRRCGFTGGSWHQDYNRHYNWCMGVKAASQNANTIARRDALARCRPPPPPGQHSFINPKWKGYIVDNCVTWATTCGGGGADNFCRLKGYKKSSKWKHNRPGATYVIGSKRVCKGGFCVGYSSITCTR